MNPSTKKALNIQLDDMDVTQLEQLVEQLQAELRELSAKSSELYEVYQDTNREVTALSNKVGVVKGRLLAARSPFKKGDIVIDDQGVRYRVHTVYTESSWVNNTTAKAGSVWGIRLTKTGNEAYAKPREIVSSAPLKKEEQV